MIYKLRASSAYGALRGARMQRTNRQSVLVTLALALSLAAPPTLASAAPKQIYIRDDDGQMLEYVLVEDDSAESQDETPEAGSNDAENVVVETIEPDGNPLAAPATEQITDADNPLAAPQAAAVTPAVSSKSMALGGAFGLMAACGGGLLLFFDRQKRDEDGDEDDGLIEYEED